MTLKVGFTRMLTYLFKTMLGKTRVRRRLRRHGFRSRMLTVGGRRVLKARRSKGRHAIAVTAGKQ